MRIVVLKTEHGLRGSTPADHEGLGKFERRLETMPPGSWMRIEWSTPRNGPHHRKMMALFQLVTECSEIYNTVDKVMHAVKLIVGHCDMVPDPRTGELTPAPKSIAFNAMSQEDFEPFYEAAIDGVLQYILPTMSRETADRLLDHIVEGWT